jgi:cell shape-determining protein MreC
MRKKRNFITWIVLLSVFFLFFNYFLKSSNIVREKSLLFFSPVQELLLKKGADFSLNLKILTNMNIAKENIEILKKENRKLSAEISSLLSVKEENEALRKALNFDLDENINLIFSKIIGKDLITGEVFIKHNSNLEEGMAVINEDGVLVGIVEEKISESVSKVRLLISTKSAIEIKVQNADLPLGVLRGSGRGAFIELLPKDKSLNYGDYVTAVPTGEGITKEIYVGRVYEITNTDVEAFKSAIIWQGVNYPSLNYLFVID